MNVNQSDKEVEGILRHFEELILREFGDDVAQVYIGDVGIYPPTAFQDAAGNNKLAISVQVDNIGKADKRTVSAAGEVRPLTINLVAMVNMIPFYEAMPTEAYGELMLVRFVTRFYEWLTLTENQTLNGLVTSSEVVGVDFDFMQRGNMAIRAAAIQWEASIYIDKMY